MLNQCYALLRVKVQSDWGGLIGRLFREFAVTVGVAIIMSGVISLTLTPMMCGRTLGPHKETGRAGRISAFMEAGFERTRICLKIAAAIRSLVKGDDMQEARLT